MRSPETKGSLHESMGELGVSTGMGQEGRQEGRAEEGMGEGGGGSGSSFMWSAEQLGEQEWQRVQRVESELED